MTRMPFLAVAIAAAALVASVPARADSRCNQSTETYVQGDGNTVINNTKCIVVERDDTDRDPPVVYYQTPVYPARMMYGFARPMMPMFYGRGYRR
jgi:hypothetical protein